MLASRFLSREVVSQTRRQFMTNRPYQQHYTFIRVRLLHTVWNGHSSIEVPKYDNNFLTKVHLHRLMQRLGLFPFWKKNDNNFRRYFALPASYLLSDSSPRPYSINKNQLVVTRENYTTRTDRFKKIALVTNHAAYSSLFALCGQSQHRRNCPKSGQDSSTHLVNKLVSHLISDAQNV
jgi:hypothetical protein